MRTSIVVAVLLLILTFNGRISECKVSCLVCDNMKVNISSPSLPTTGCLSEDNELCTLILRIDYENPNKSFALTAGSDEEQLILTNGEPQTNDVTSIWFNKVTVQRLVNIICFSGTSCGFDILQDIYKNKRETSN